MNTLIFLAGAGFGVVLFTIVCGLFVALNRRQTKEQREANERTNAAMDEGNRLRQVRADAMNRIAEAIEKHVYSK